MAKYAAAFADQDNLKLMRKENARLQKVVAKLEAQLKRKDEQLALLQDLVKDLEREKGELRARAEGHKAGGSGGSQSAPEGSAG